GPGRQRVDVVPVAGIGREPSGRGMRVAEEPELLERGHLVADRGTRHAEVGALGDRLGADRLTRPDVLLDDRVQHGSFALPELSAVGHAPDDSWHSRPQSAKERDSTTLPTPS